MFLCVKDHVKVWKLQLFEGNPVTSHVRTRKVVLPTSHRSLPLNNQRSKIKQELSLRQKFYSHYNYNLDMCIRCDDRISANIFLFGIFHIIRPLEVLKLTKILQSSDDEWFVNCDYSTMLAKRNYTDLMVNTEL